MGPVAICAAVLLLVASPLMRGGNRQIALIGLEAIALVFLVSLWIRTAWTWGSWRSTPQSLLNKTAVAILVQPSERPLSSYIFSIRVASVA